MNSSPNNWNHYAPNKTSKVINFLNPKWANIHPLSGITKKLFILNPKPSATNQSTWILNHYHHTITPSHQHIIIWNHEPRSRADLKPFSVNNMPKIELPTFMSRHGVGSMPPRSSLKQRLAQTPNLQILNLIRQNVGSKQESLNPHSWMFKLLIPDSQPWTLNRVEPYNFGFTASKSST